MITNTIDDAADGDADNDDNADAAVGDDNNDDDDDGSDGVIMREMSTRIKTTMAATLPNSNSCYLVSNGPGAGQLQLYG